MMSLSLKLYTNTEGRWWLWDVSECAGKCVWFIWEVIYAHEPLFSSH